jgi:hypothetical protein
MKTSEKLGVLIGMVAQFFPLALGLVAEGFNHSFVMWLLLLGPLALLIGPPRPGRTNARK